MHGYRPGNPLVFTHIPKSVGTSLREAVRARLEPTVEFNGFGRAELGGFTELDTVHPAIRAQILMEPGELPEEVEFISGHIEPSLTRARFPEADHFTVLREPRVRVLSTWLFARSHSDFNLRGWGSFAAWMCAARSPLHDYLANPLVAPHTDNATVRLLLWPHDLIPSDGFIHPAHDDQLLQEAIGMLDSFAYAGLVEAPGWVDRLGDWLGCDLELPRLQEVGSLPQPDSPDLEAEIAGPADELLLQRTRIDARLWRHLATGHLAPEAVDETSDRAYRKALDRYSDLLSNPCKLPLRRRAIEGAYSAMVHLRRGSHASAGLRRAS